MGWMQRVQQIWQHCLELGDALVSLTQMFVHMALLAMSCIVFIIAAVSSCGSVAAVSCSAFVQQEHGVFYTAMSKVRVRVSQQYSVADKCAACRHQVRCCMCLRAWRKWHTVVTWSIIALSEPLHCVRASACCLFHNIITASALGMLCIAHSAVPAWCSAYEHGSTSCPAGLQLRWQVLAQQRCNMLAA